MKSEEQDHLIESEVTIEKMNAAFQKIQKYHYILMFVIVLMRTLFSIIDLSPPHLYKNP